MSRSLTLAEASLVSNRSLGDGNRPSVYTAASDTSTEISSDFEAFLILTPISVRNQIASFFQTIIDNDPNSLQVYSELLSEFLDEEMGNDTDSMRVYDDYTSLYDQTREEYSAAADGFTDIAETANLQVALTTSLGQIAEQRDRYLFNYSVLSVLRTRSDNSGRESFVRELQSWIRALVTYE